MQAEFLSCMVLVFVYAPGRKNTNYATDKPGEQCRNKVTLKAMQEGNLCSQGKGAFKMPEKCFPDNFSTFFGLNFCVLKMIIRNVHTIMVNPIV